MHARHVDRAHITNLILVAADGESSQKVDGLPAGEGVFLPCTFWLADNYLLQGRREEAQHVFERLLAIANDVGLLSENTTPAAGGSSATFHRPSPTCP